MNDDYDKLKTTVQTAIMEVVDAHRARGEPTAETALVASVFAMAPALGFVAAAMGRKKPTQAQATAMTNRIVEMIGELPEVNA